jgi:hypothetical protein
MRTSVSESLETELQGLNDAIAEKDAETASTHEAAEKLVADIRGSGTNPLTDKDAFEKVDEAYKVSDTVREEASQLRQRRERVLEILGQRKPSAAVKRSAQGAVEKFMASPKYLELRDAGAFSAQ